MLQPGGRQHVIPASHIGSFSDSENPSKRERPVWFRRDGMKKAVSVKAENVGIHKHIYTLKADSKVDDRYVDKTWDYVEHNLPLAIHALEEHTKSLLFDGLIWSTILVPFVAQIFVRGVEYSKNLLARAPALEELDSIMGPHAVEDNTNLNRLIDYQINCGLLCDAEWRLLHNWSDVPFVLNDLGYAIFNARDYGVSRGYLIPMSKTLMIIITKRNPTQKDIEFYGFKNALKIKFLQSSITNKYKVMSLNNRIAKCADSEVYGATEEVVNQVWGDRETRRKEVAVGPTYIQHRQLRDAELLDVYGMYLNKFGVSGETIKGVLGGRLIHVIEETRGNKMYALAYKDL